MQSCCEKRYQIGYQKWNYIAILTSSSWTNLLRVKMADPFIIQGTRISLRAQLFVRVIETRSVVTLCSMIQSIDLTFLFTVNELEHHIIQFHHIMKSMLYEYNNMNETTISCLHIACYARSHA